MEKHKTRKRLRKNTKRKNYSSEEFIESSQKKKISNRRLTSSVLDRKEVNNFLRSVCDRLPCDQLCNSSPHHSLGIPIPESIGLKTSLILLTLYGIAGKIPDSICLLTNLRSLELSKGSIEGEIPTNIGNLKQLESLSLSQNQISGNIPESLFTLTRLDSLNLGHNKLEGKLSESIWNLIYLSSLNLSNNINLTGDISENIGRLKDLEYFHFDRTSINSFIPDSIEQCEELESISISYESDSLNNIALMQMCNLVLTEKIPRLCRINIFHYRDINSLVFSEDEVFNYVPNEQDTYQQYQELEHQHLLTYVQQIKTRLEDYEPTLM